MNKMMKISAVALLASVGVGSVAPAVAVQWPVDGGDVVVVSSAASVAGTERLREVVKAIGEASGTRLVLKQTIEHPASEAEMVEQLNSEIAGQLEIELADWLLRERFSRDALVESNNDLSREMMGSSQVFVGVGSVPSFWGDVNRQTGVVVEGDSAAAQVKFDSSVVSVSVVPDGAGGWGFVGDVPGFVVFEVAPGGSIGVDGGYGAVAPSNGGVVSAGEAGVSRFVNESGVPVRVLVAGADGTGVSGEGVRVASDQSFPVPVNTFDVAFPDFDKQVQDFEYVEHVAASGTGVVTPQPDKPLISIPEDPFPQEPKTDEDVTPTPAPSDGPKVEQPSAPAEDSKQEEDKVEPSTPQPDKPLISIPEDPFPQEPKTDEDVTPTPAPSDGGNSEEDKKATGNPNPSVPKEETPAPSEDNNSSSQDNTGDMVDGDSSQDTSAGEDSSTSESNGSDSTQQNQNEPVSPSETVSPVDGANTTTNVQQGLSEASMGGENVMTSQGSGMTVVQEKNQQVKPQRKVMIETGAEMTGEFIAQVSSAFAMGVGLLTAVVRRGRKK